MESEDVCYRSGSKWYTDLMCGREGSILPKRDWSPLVFYIIIFLVCMIICILDNYGDDIIKGYSILISLLMFILISSIVTMLILNKQTGWAWFVVFLPFIITFISMIVGFFYILFDSNCPHCYGTCKKE